MPDFIQAIFYLSIWCLAGMFGYRRIEGCWSWACLLGFIYGPFIWLANKGWSKDMVIILAPPNCECLYSGSNISTIALRMHAAGISYHNNSYIWNAEDSTVFMLDSESDTEKLKDLLAMCALAGINLEAPLTKEERDKLL